MKKKILYGALGLATILVPLASCKDDDSNLPVDSSNSSNAGTIKPGNSNGNQGKYDVNLSKPMILNHSSENAQYYWIPVKGAKGYVAKIDNGEPFGIGNPIYEGDDGKMCAYVQT